MRWAWQLSSVLWPETTPLSQTNQERPYGGLAKIHHTSGKTTAMQALAMNQASSLYVENCTRKLRCL